MRRRDYFRTVPDSGWRPSLHETLINLLAQSEAKTRLSKVDAAAAIHIRRGTPESRARLEHHWKAPYEPKGRDR